MMAWSVEMPALLRDLCSRAEPRVKRKLQGVNVAVVTCCP